MTRRRTLLGSIVGVVTLTAGCSSDSGNTTDTQTPDVETLEITDTSETEDAPGSTSSEVTESNDEERSTPKPKVEFHVELDNISECGLTCRKIEYTLQNRGQLSAKQMGVSIRVHTGGEQVYDATQSIGDLQSQTQKTGITHQIDVGLSGGNAIQSNDGEITLTLEPESKNGSSKVFTFERTLDV
jgi:hypothetical protein